MTDQEAFETWHAERRKNPEPIYQQAIWHAALAWLRSQGEPAVIPDDVQYALDRMCTPMHESRLSGVTAEADARCMQVIREYIERTAAPQHAIPDGWQSNAARDVLAERIRQMENEGWTHLHDDEHSDGSMAQAAACYALGAATDNPDRHVMDRFGIEGTPYRIHSLWPWDRKWFKPHSRRRDLVKAAALILAEIERLDRKMLAAAPESRK